MVSKSLIKIGIEEPDTSGSFFMPENYVSPSVTSNISIHNLTYHAP